MTITGPETGLRLDLQRSAISRYLAKDFDTALRKLIAADDARGLDSNGIELLIQLYLLTGEIKAGWDFFGRCCRDNRFGVAVPHYNAATEWRGEPVCGKRVVVWTGGGLGDQIFYARYLSRLLARGGYVAVDCPSSLVELLQSIPGIENAKDHCGDLRSFDYQIPMAELPMHFGGEHGWIWDQATPYLHANPYELHEDALCVGVAWAAHRKNSVIEERSATIEALEPLTSVPGVQLYSLQVGTAASELEKWPKGGSIRPLSTGTPTFAEQASQICGLDVVITVDTAVANLAGALGKPTWVAVSEVPNWRWGLYGDTTCWYPSARIYRQNSVGDWHSVFARMANDLRLFRKEHTAHRRT